MAISGDISDLPLPDLLNMIRFRGGLVTLTETQRATEMVLAFSPGYVTGFSIERQVIRVETQVVDRLFAVAAMPVGRFHYEPAPTASMRGSVRIPVDRLALCLVSKVDEVNIAKETLPSPSQVFRLRDEDSVIREIVKHVGEPDLVNFVLESKHLLFTGVSADRLAELHQIGVDVARYYLYKLNLLGIVVPAKRDSLWATLDAALQPKSSGIRLVKQSPLPPMARPIAPPAGPAESSMLTGALAGGGGQTMTMERTRSLIMSAASALRASFRMG